MVHVRTFLPALALCALAACRSSTPPGVYFDTLPPGAEVLIDDRRSGWVTPCMIALDEDSDYEVRLELAGFEPRELTLQSANRTDRVPWSDGAPAPNGQWVPLALGAQELFIPYRRNEAHAPSRIFFRLKPLPESPDSN